MQQQMMQQQMLEQAGMGALQKAAPAIAGKMDPDQVRQSMERMS
jgi:hypothetical protein